MLSMSSIKTNPSKTQEVKVLFFSIPSEILLQLGAGGMLAALVGGKAVAETLQAIGEASEEIFRGDRLPVLKFPVETQSESN